MGDFGDRFLEATETLITTAGNSVTYYAPVTRSTDDYGDTLGYTQSASSSKTMAIQHIGFLDDQLRKEGIWSVGDIRVECKPSDDITDNSKIVMTDGSTWRLNKIVDEDMSYDVNTSSVFRGVRID